MAYLPKFGYFALFVVCGFATTVDSKACSNVSENFFFHLILCLLDDTWMEVEAKFYKVFL